MSSNPLQLEASDGRLHLAASELVDFQYLRTLAYELYGAASVGEVLRAAHDIARKGGTRDVYIDTWAEQGRHNARRAQEALALGQHQTARTHFLRAYNYLRAAEFFFDRRDRANFDAIYFESVAAFDQAIALFEMPVEKIDIPFENGVSMPGYFFKGREGRPTPRDGNLERRRRWAWRGDLLSWRRSRSPCTGPERSALSRPWSARSSASPSRPGHARRRRDPLWSCG